MEAYAAAPFAQLVWADPPFNIDWKYDIYLDRMTDEQFIQWNLRWISAAINKVLLPHGSIIICMYDEYVSDIDVICRRQLGLTRQNWCIWNFSFGQSGELEKRRRFTRSKTHMLWYTRDPEQYKFYPTRIAVPSARQLLYNDKRADSRGKVPDDVIHLPGTVVLSDEEALLLTAPHDVPSDVMVHKRIAGTHKERVAHMSTQMPIPLVEPFILGLTDPGDIVFDPFAGGGAGPKAAKKNDRQFVACELSPAYHALLCEALDC
jgi:site-specific DNA-methyltransferase (adenine-specific)